jgi:hypothetical protein
MSCGAADIAPALGNHEQICLSREAAIDAKLRLPIYLAAQVNRQYLSPLRGSVGWNSNLT